ncbi:GDP-mannose 4,6-dehydratase [bacterium]|nr:GDP-mannose 4,6-dehydratase [bacterium]
MPADAPILVTGAAGFIGRWVVRHLLRETDGGAPIVGLDDLSNGSRENLAEFEHEPRLHEFIEADIRDIDTLTRLFAKHRFGAVFHLAARINVQESIDDPRRTFETDVTATFELLELARAVGSRVVMVSTCMVYERSLRETGIREDDPVKPASPYAAAKLAGEHLALGHFHAYGLPVAVLRPFNTYGPYQKSSGEGGVVAIFCERALAGEPLSIYGDGTQTRDFLYVTDCARFIVEAGMHPAATGRVLNAGLGEDISINDLARLVGGPGASIEHVAHIHPQSEIMKLRCDRSLARELVGWEPRVGLAEGIRATRDWIASRRGAA